MTTKESVSQLSQRPIVNAAEEDTIDDKKLHTSIENDQEVIDDWGNNLDFHLFAGHKPHPVYFPEGSFPHLVSKGGESSQKYFTIECVEELTPLDMMTLTNGESDTTGHCVWMGAFLLVEFAEEIMQKYVMVIKNHPQEDKDGNHEVQHKESIISGPKILELGAGTGIGGIALLAANAYSSNEETGVHITFTDNDTNVLEVCERNCILNPNLLSPTIRTYDVSTLHWSCNLEEIKEQLPPPTKELFFYDTVLATDVLYDIGVLPALLMTAVSNLKLNGYFVLSHVPRACYSSEHPPVNNLEKYLIEKALSYNLHLQEIIRPLRGSKNIYPKNALNNISQDEMYQVGGAILIFRKEQINKQEQGSL